MLGQHRHERFGDEGRLARDEVVDDAADGIDVGAVVGVLAFGLLGRHVFGVPKIMPVRVRRGPFGSRPMTLAMPKSRNLHEMGWPSR